MNKIKNIEDFFREVDDIYHYSNLSMIQKQEKIRDLKLEYSRLFPSNDSNYYYFLGYAGYIARDLGDETESYFRESLRLDPTNDFCKYYYAYFLFDAKRFKDAFTILAYINLKYFEELGNTWMVFKIKEASVCCCLFLPDFNDREKIEMIDKFLTEYEMHLNKEDNKYMDPINYMHEIISSVSQLLENLGDNFRPLVTRITKLMKIEGLDTTYNDEYKKMLGFLDDMSTVSY